MPTHRFCCTSRQMAGVIAHIQTLHSHGMSRSRRRRLPVGPWTRQEDTRKRCAGRRKKVGEHGLVLRCVVFNSHLRCGATARIAWTEVCTCVYMYTYTSMCTYTSIGGLGRARVTPLRPDSVPLCIGLCPRVPCETEEVQISPCILNSRRAENGNTGYVGNTE